MFSHEELTPLPGPVVFSLEGYYLPAVWRRFVRVRPDGTRVIPIVHPAGAVIELKAIFLSEGCARQNFLGLEMYTLPLIDDEIHEAAFTISGSTGNLRKNEQGQVLGDGIFCRHPRSFDVTAGCIDTDLHPQVEVTPASQANLSSRSHTCIMQCGSCSLKAAVTNQRSLDYPPPTASRGP